MNIRSVRQSFSKYSHGAKRVPGTLLEVNETKPSLSWNLLSSRKESHTRRELESRKPTFLPVPSPLPHSCCLSCGQGFEAAESFVPLSLKLSEAKQHHYSPPSLLLLFSRSGMSYSLRPHRLQHARPPCPSPTPRAHSNSCPSSRWCHPTISSSVIPFSSCLQSFQHQGLFQWVSSLHQVAEVLEGQLQHQSFQWTFRVDFPLSWVHISVAKDLLEGLQSWAPSVGEVTWSASPSRKKKPLQTHSGSLCQLF